MNDKITIVLNGVSRVVFMSYGLLNRLVRVVSDLPDLSQVMVNPEAQERLLKEILVKRDAEGNPVGPHTLDELEMSIEDATRLLNWATDHVLTFFVSGLATLKEIDSRHSAKIGALMPSSTGTAP